jgi:mitogen-activated protein kinase kinase kinase
LPPPPPLNQSQTQGQPYGYGPPHRQPTLNIPPPPPQNDKPVLSATYYPTGDSFGPGVGIPPLDDYAAYMRYDAQLTSEPGRSSTDQGHSEGTYKPINYTYPNPAQPNPDIANRENRAASASSKIAPLHLQKNETVSPGPPTATKINPQLENATRQRAQSAAVGVVASSGLDAQWPQDRVSAFLTANGFSKDWQETFRTLKLEGASFLDLGRGRNGRSNFGTMHQHVYPQLARVTSANTTGWDQSREREEGKRLRKLVSRIVEGDGPNSAGSGHKRRESGMIPSASTEGTLENSPHMGQSEFAGDSSPGRSTPSQYSAGGLGPRNSQQGRSSTLPVFSKQSSSNSTPSEPRHPDSLQNGGRLDYTRGVLSSIGRGRHSPNLSGDASAGGLAPNRPEASPGSSPGLGYAVPSSATTHHSKSNSQDLGQKALIYSRSGLNIPGPSMSDTQVPTERFYEMQNRRDGQELVRPSTIDGHRTYSNDAPLSASIKDQSKGFLDKILRKRHDHAQGDDHALKSPTSPGSLKSIFSKPSANGSDTALGPRPSSATTLDSDRSAARLRRETRTPKKFVFVTPDYWNYRLVDITGQDNPASLRKLLCIELGLTDFDTAQFFYTEAGQTDHDQPLTDQKLLSAQSQADNLGTVKIYIRSALVSAVSAPGANALKMTFSQRATGGQPMIKSNSAGGFSPNGLRASPSNEALARAAEEYRRQTDAKQRAYLEQRQNRKDTTRSNVIDFDSPRMSPFEEKKSVELVPLRKPPTAPSESGTLTKVNSLRAKNGSGTRSSLDALKRISDPIAEERAAGGKNSKSGTPTPVTGIGAALVNAGKMAGSPATLSGGRSGSTQSVDFSQKGSNPGGSPRPSSTWSKGNIMFNVPDYDDAGEMMQQTRPRPPNPRLQDVQSYTQSPAFSPSTDRAPKPVFHSRQSFSPDLEFKETNVSFAPSPRPPAAQDDSDDDSDDGLFAIPLTNKALPKVVDKPTLHLDTDQHVRKPRVAFKSPNSSGGVSINRNSHDESVNSGSAGGYERNYSDGSYSGSAMSPEDRMGRRDSFASDIWASRPAAENVVNNLDEFFPGVDLDKPFMAESADSPMKQVDATPVSLRSKMTYGTDGLDLGFNRRNDSDTLGSDESTLKAKDQQAVASVAQRQMGKFLGGITRMKSIREVAQRRNDLVRGPSVAVRVEPSKASGIVRRKSTKMFGANIVQIKPRPGNRLSTLDPIPQEDVPSEDKPARQATFKIIRGKLIGKGTYGRVYLGMNATTGEFLAVKQVEVNQKLAGQDKDRIKEMVGALDSEIDTMKDLEHPNIVQYLGCERAEMSISIYLEYISGGSIGSCLRKHGKFEESVVRALTRQTLEGLAYLHQEGILHRDLKADNILLDVDGSCKISDFGISKRSDDIYRNDVTNSMQGSVFWMAPEVVKSQGQGYSAKIDIWSLGCVVLEMFAGKRPWSREEAIGAIFKLGNLNQAPPIPDDVQEQASFHGLNFMYDCFQM